MCMQRYLCRCVKRWSVGATAASGGRRLLITTTQYANWLTSNIPLDCILILITNPICPYQNSVCLHTESSHSEDKMYEGQTDEGGGQQSSDSSSCDDKSFFFLSPCHFWFGPHMYPWGMGMFIRGHFSQNTALCNECLCMFSLCIVFIFKRHFSCWYSHNPTNEKQKGSDFLSGSSNSSLWSNPP